MDIYIKPVKRAVIRNGNTVKIRDLAEVITDKDKKSVVLEITVLQKEPDKKNYLITIIDLIKAITDKYPNATVNNVGEEDIWVEFEKPKKEGKTLKFLKIAFVTCVLTVGASTAIMSFHTDSQIPQVFQNYYKILFGEEKEKPLIIEIPYSFGLAAGILVFFNHFAGKRLTEDPTPIEVEMYQYDNNVIDTVISLLNNAQQVREGDKK